MLILERLCLTPEAVLSELMFQILVSCVFPLLDGAPSLPRVIRPKITDSAHI